MLIQPTLDTLNRLKLHGMALGLSEQMTNSTVQQLGFEERVALLLEREVLHRENRRLGRLLKQAQLKLKNAVMEGIDYRSRSGLDRPQLASLTSCDWIRSNQSLLIHGATGSGKTYLACALAHQACRAGLSAWYVRAPRLFEELNLCHADGTFRKRLAAIAKINLLVIDDFAISPIGPRERNDLLELLDDRVGNSASILASQLPVDHWHEYLNSHFGGSDYGSFGSLIASDPSAGQGVHTQALPSTPVTSAGAVTLTASSIPFSSLASAEALAQFMHDTAAASRAPALNSSIEVLHAPNLEVTAFELVTDSSDIGSIQGRASQRGVRFFFHHALSDDS